MSPANLPLFRPRAEPLSLPSVAATSHFPCEYVPGFFSWDAPPETVARSYDEYIERFVALFPERRGPRQGPVLLDFARRAMSGMVAEHRVVWAGRTHDTPGPIVYAFSHNIPFLDGAGLLLCLQERFPGRPVGIVSSARTLDRVVPEWRSENGGTPRLIEVTWTTGADGRVRVTNGRDVIAACCALMTSARGAMVCIAPEGRRSLLRNGLLRAPHRGLDDIVEATGAVVVPVVTTGARDPRHPSTFARIVTTVLDPLPPRDPGSAASERWLAAILAFLRCQEG